MRSCECLLEALFPSRLNLTHHLSHSPNSGVTAHVDDQCARGAQIEYTTDMLAEHVLEQYVQFLISYEWVVNTFNGKTPITGACQRKNNAVSPMPDVTSDVTRKLVGPAAVERLLAILK